ncbi:MAG: hypothetical protein IJP92_00015 [Lachnospiraceae bacterium]|nr:hypothetical protein [Lachnospiraceae bacterium]
MDTVTLFYEDHFYEATYVRAFCRDNELFVTETISEKAPGERYHLSLCFDEVNTGKLARRLFTSPDRLLKRLKTLFSGRNGFSSFRRFCDLTGVKYSMHA